MNTLAIKLVIICLLWVTVSTQIYAQAPMITVEEGGKMPAKLDKNKVPKLVIDTHTKEYPSNVSDTWYGYPTFSDESDWYGYNPYKYPNSYPEYYIVTFIKEKTPHKVIYAKSGKAIATHKVMTTDLPKPVMEDLSNGDFKNWKLASRNEEIFKDSDADIMIVYKVTVQKEKEKRILFYMPDGKLIKIKKVKA